jgi:hypothetical protein
MHVDNLRRITPSFNENSEPRADAASAETAAVGGPSRAAEETASAEHERCNDKKGDSAGGVSWQ